jgi:hypothetical protein
MKKIATLALILTMFASCEDTNQIQQCPFVMIFSDALPIQVWQGDCATHNESIPSGYFKRCFYAPWLCSKPVKFQFQYVDPGNYTLTAIHSEDGSEISTIPFEQEGVNLLPNLEFTNENFTSSITPWESFPGSNASTQQGWVWASDGGLGTASANSTITGTGVAKEATKYLSAARPGGGNWPAGSYLLSVRLRNASTYGGSGGDNIGLNVWGMDSMIENVILTVTGGPGSIPRDNAYHTYMFFVTLDKPYQYIGFTCVRQGGGGTFAIKADFDFIVIDSAPAVYEKYIFTADYDLLTAPGFECGERIRFDINDESASPSLIGHTDDIQTTDDQNELVTIEYSNPTDYNGLSYTSIADTFTIYIPAVFFRQRQTEEVEVVELSTKTEVTSSKIKTQRYLETGYMPEYMHNKMGYVLAHKNLEILGKKWKKEEGYERSDVNRMHESRKGSVWLTEADTIVRNV